MTLLAWTRGLHILAAVVATMAAHVRPRHRPIALFLGVTALADVMTTAIRAAGYASPVPISAPLSGSTAVMAYTAVMLFLLWPAGLAALSIAVFQRRPPWIVGVSYVAVAVGVWLAYPAIRLDRRTYLAVECIALAASLGCQVLWYWRKEAPTMTHLCAFLVVAVDFVTLAGPYLGDPFRDWHLAQLAYACLYAALILIQGGISWASPRTSPSSRR